VLFTNNLDRLESAYLFFQNLHPFFFVSAELFFLAPAVFAFCFIVPPLTLLGFFLAQLFDDVHSLGITKADLPAKFWDIIMAIVVFVAI